MHTEEEAKKLWCHQTRRPHSENCVASGCMAWRWNGFFDEDGFWERYNDTGAHRQSTEPRGYCGLAGAPQVEPNAEQFISALLSQIKDTTE